MGGEEYSHRQLLQGNKISTSNQDIINLNHTVCYNGSEVNANRTKAPLIYNREPSFNLHINKINLNGKYLTPHSFMNSSDNLIKGKELILCVCVCLCVGKTSSENELQWIKYSKTWIHSQPL